MADPEVLASQQWLNKTFGDIDGYVACAEDGSTGQQTESSLIMGLQSLLGISPVVASFGPTTWADLKTYGDVADGSSTDMITLVQAGLYCKGYDGSALSGEWDARTIAGVNKLQEDLGYSSTEVTSTMYPKLFRFLLNTNPAVLIAGGNPTVRAAQQWLNIQYIGRENFVFASSDGIFDRDTQTNLVYGIQYELGLSDAIANGNFGPTTNADLQASKDAAVGSGSVDSTHNWVHLFKAALSFNGWVPANFDGTFTTADAELTQAFQQFEGFTTAEQTSMADYTTWCELLVSTGNPNRPGTGADMASTITADRASALVSAGYQYVGRYLTNQQITDPLDKDIKPGELDTIFAAGLKLFLIFEEGGYNLSWFSYDQGVDDAERAVTAAQAYGIPVGAVIYFAVDVDAEQVDIDSVVLPYFRGVRAKVAAMGGDYVIGVYGARNTCTMVSDHGLARFSFVGGLSTGWSGNLGFPMPSNWAFNQIQSLTVDPAGAGAVDIDKNVVSGRDTGVSNTNQPAPANHAFFAWLDTLQALADGWVADHSDSDSANLLVLEYIRFPNYGSATGEYSGAAWGWDAIAGVVDADWRVYPDNQGLTRVDSYTDPAQSVHPLDPEHMAASANGVIHHNGIASDLSLNLGDAGGWAGDMLTLMTDFVLHNPGKLSAKAYAETYIAESTVPQVRSFPYDDYVEDTDGLLIGLAALSSPSTPMNNLIRDYYSPGGGYADRFSQMKAQRFATSDTTVQAATEAILAQPAGTDAGWALFRVSILEKYGVDIDKISTADSTAFGQAHADVLNGLVADE